MQHTQENIQLKAGSLRNVIIDDQKFKNIPYYERGGKCIQSLFKAYQDALPEDLRSIGFSTLRDIVKLLTIRGESNYVLSTY